MRSRSGPAVSLLTATALVTALAAAAPSDAGAAASEVAANPQSSVRLISPWTVAPAGGEAGDGELWLGLHFTTIPGWHVYWKNSGDAGYPPAVSFAATPEVEAAELLWPAPERYELPGGLVAFGYEEEVVYPVRLRLDAADPLRLDAEVDYLVCEVECIPYTYRLVLDQPVAEDGEEAEIDDATAPLLDAYRQRLPQPPAALGLTTDAVLYRRSASGGGPAGGDELVVRVARRDGAPIAADDVELFFEPHSQLDLGRPAGREIDGSLAMRVPVSYFDTGDVPAAATEVAWTVTGLGSAEAPASFEARQRVPIRAADPDQLATAGETAPPTAAGPTWPATVGPALGALLAVAAALLCWGLLGRRPRSAEVAADGAATGGGPGGELGRGLLGFGALAAGFFFLYRLSRVATAETVAFVELSLLGVVLTAWGAGAARRRPLLRAALGAAALGLAAVTLWLALPG